jgi:hypothetical protein
MANYVYKILNVKHGIPSGSNTMPASGSLTLMPNTVKGSVKLSESAGTTVQFEVDQLSDPIMVVADKSGQLTAEMKFYDVDYTLLAVLKGGTGNASGYAPATGPVNILKAIQVDTVSGHRFSFYNGFIEATLGGVGSSADLFTVDVKVTALAATDGAGSWKVGPST